MEIYLAGTPVTLTVPLVDGNGNVLTVTSISYRVINQSGVELVATTPLTAYVSGASATITLSSLVNTLDPVPTISSVSQVDTYLVREVRTVEMFLNVGGNTTVLTSSYALQPLETLVVGINSFQGLALAELTALDIPNTPGWNNASERDKTAALIDARIHICQLNFWMLNSNVAWGQDNLNYVPEGSYMTPYATASGGGPFAFNGNLALLTPAQFINLPGRFKTALCRAQIAESDSILGGDLIGEKRRDGIVVDTIGDVKQMFRQSKPLDLPCSHRALEYLSQYVTFAKKLGRG